MTDIIPTNPAAVPNITFWTRFTRPERTAIRVAAQTDPVVEDWLDLLHMVTTVDTTHAFIINRLTAFEQAGLLQPGRAAEILAG